MRRVTPVILCGGSGARLWPRSRPEKPKPFLALLNGESLFQHTIGRFADATRFSSPMIVASEGHVEHIEEQLGHVGAALIVEPSGRNTAAAIGLAASQMAPDEIMLVCPSDHRIENEGAFIAASASAAELAARDWIVALTAEAERPHTGFGYLRRGAAIDGIGFEVESFVEKPDLAQAQSYVSSGAYSWNTGIFAFKAGVFLEELQRYRPETASALARSVADGRHENAHFFPGRQDFETIAAEAVDFAVMENSDRVALVPVDMGWSDLGSWDAIWAAREKDAEGNVASTDATLVSCRNVLIDSDGPRVKAVGIEGVAVVVSGSDILVTKIDHGPELSSDR